MSNWVKVADGTYALPVPGGMVLDIVSDTPEKVLYVNCGDKDATKYISENEIKEVACEGCNCKERG